jgi:hypothetical protein
MRAASLAKAALAHVASVKTTPFSQTTKQQLPHALSNARAVQGNTLVVHPRHPKGSALSVRQAISNLQIPVGWSAAYGTGFALRTITFWMPLCSKMGTALLMGVLIQPRE